MIPLPQRPNLHPPLALLPTLPHRLQKGPSMTWMMSLRVLRMLRRALPTTSLPTSRGQTLMTLTPFSIAALHLLSPKTNRPTPPTPLELTAATTLATYLLRLLGPRRSRRTTLVQRLLGKGPSLLTTRNGMRCSLPWMKLLPTMAPANRQHPRPMNNHRVPCPLSRALLLLGLRILAEHLRRMVHTMIQS